MGNSPETNLSKFSRLTDASKLKHSRRKGTGSREDSVWKLPSQASDHEVDLAEEPFTLKPLYGEVRPAEMWRSANKTLGN